MAIKEVSTAKYERLAVEHDISEAAVHQLCQRHRNVINFVESFTEGGSTFIVTEFAEGGSLLSFLQARNHYSLPEDHSRKIFAQLARAVQFMHKHGVVHRDLKHMNILLSDNTEDAIVKVTDFGIATYLEQDEFIKKQAGTAGFMAPEVAQNQLSNHKADVWSLGVILYALICSRVPFSGPSKEETRSKIINEQLKFADAEWAHVHPSLLELISGMLTKDPKHRFSMKDVVDHPWVNAVPATI